MFAVLAFILAVVVAIIEFASRTTLDGNQLLGLLFITLALIALHLAYPVALGRRSDFGVRR